jgi:hypothetical protein
VAIFEDDADDKVKINGGFENGNADNGVVVLGVKRGFLDIDSGITHRICKASMAFIFFFSLGL